MLHDLLKTGRERSGLTTRVLAEKAAIDQALISKFEKRETDSDQRTSRTPS